MINTQDEATLLKEKLPEDSNLDEKVDELLTLANQSVDFSVTKGVLEAELGQKVTP